MLSRGFVRWIYFKFIDVCGKFISLYQGWMQGEAWGARAPLDPGYTKKLLTLYPFNYETFIAGGQSTSK